MAYTPDATAQLNDVEFTALLSERDLALQIPLPFVSLPRLSLTRACFAHGTYLEQAAVKCFSNLIAASISSFDIDVYWDPSQRAWSLCPFQLASSDQSSSSSSVAANVATAPPLATTSTLRPRQTPSTSNTDDSLGNSGVQLPDPTRTASNPVSSVIPISIDTAVVQANPFTCSNPINLAVFLQTLNGYLRDTENTYNASIQYLFLNVHAASLRSSPLTPLAVLSNTDLPGVTALGDLIANNLPNYVYTPLDLSEQRSHLNGTNNWFSQPLSWEPDTGYFTVEGAGMSTSSPDGWPGEGFVELRQSKRIVASLGRVDPQVSNYNINPDQSILFPPGYVTSERTVTYGSSGIVTGGCLYSQSQDVASMNSSWATALVLETDDLQSVLTASRNLTACAISPFLNQTLANSTADLDIRPYLAYSLTASWAWAVGEPRNYTGPDQQDIRCAAVNVTTGRWIAATCRKTLFAACKSSRNNNPYRFEISDEAASYAKVDRACPADSYFVAPRTALENLHLVNTWRDWRSRQQQAGRDAGSDLLWVNLNSLDAPLCWVVGQGSTCPYRRIRHADQRTIIVPTVAAVVVFAIAAAMVFVKCAANRRNTRRRRKRGDDGWDYDGVPS